MFEVPLVIAHISGLPVEELLPLVYGGGVTWAAVRAWTRRVRRRRDAD
jgi:hypothetical protein